MKIIKAFIVAFSIYSKIPMPRFNWESEDMQYHLIFFPFVGAFVGLCEFLWLKVGMFAGIGRIMYILVAAALPLLITGGFHLDGFMDTMDALHSYQDREKKLEILKDPHIGAFSVISLLTYVLLGIGFFSEINSENGIFVLCIAFFLSRVLSGISVVTLKSAKDKGMLQTFSTTARKNVVLAVLIVEGIIGAALMAVCDYKMAIVTACMLGLSYLYYVRMSHKQFGGITGDLAGFFVTVSELMSVIGVAVCCIIFR